MSYGRMRERQAQLESEVVELLRRAEEVDEEEDRRYGRDKRGDELPEELAFRESRLRKIREAMAALEAEAREVAESECRSHSTHPGVPGDKAQRNFTDPESHIMPGSHHARSGREGLPAGLQLSGGGGRCPSGDSGGRGDQSGVGQAAGSEHDRAGHRQRRCGAQGGVRRRGLLFGQGC